MYTILQARKMKLNVEVISREFVRPSSPTPPHLRRLDFSLLDQVPDKVCIPTIQFYGPGEKTITNFEKCNLLKKSLSRVLTLFYPLAGRVRNCSYVDCNDEGLLCVEARVSCTLSDVLRERNPINNDYFTPFRPEGVNDLGGFAQITLFECGGLAISFGLNHMVGDGWSHVTFLNSWAAAVRGDTKAIAAPPFGHASTFPPMAMPELEYRPQNSNGTLVTKIFAFDRSSIDALKAKHTITKGNRREIGRVEALTGFIVGRYNASTHSPKANDQLYKVVHVVDLRSRLEPPMVLSFGNIITAATIDAQMDAKDEYGFGITKRMRDSVADSIEYVNKHRHNSDQLWNPFKAIFETSGQKEVIQFIFSSLNKFPMYETDFGWGKPLWVGTTPLHTPNMGFFFGTKDGEGIEAWICLSEEDMAKFEADIILLQHASSSAHGRSVNAHSRM